MNRVFFYSPEQRPLILLFAVFALLPLAVAILINIMDWWEHRGEGSPDPSGEPDA